MNSKVDQKKGRPSVMLVGLGEEGGKAVLSSLDQFDAPEYAFAVCDVANVLINIEEPRLTHTFYVAANWERCLPMVLEGSSLYDNRWWFYWIPNRARKRRSRASCY